MASVASVLQAFADHDHHSHDLADELEAARDDARADPSCWTEFLYTANHTIGEHLDDWPRAAKLGASLLEGQYPNAETAPAWGHFATALFMAGDNAGADIAAATYILHTADPGDADADTKLMRAMALVSAHRVAEGAALYESVLASGASASAKLTRRLAIASNNLGAELCDQPTRTLDEDALMQRAADAAYEFWRACGTWQNEERALHLKALVANQLGHPRDAVEFADEALAIIETNGEAPVDAAFLHLACADALAQLGETAEHRRELAEADALIAAWDGDDVKAWYAAAREKIAEL